MTRVYFDDRNYLEQITEIFAFVSVDKDGEGIIGQSMETPGGLMFMPFVCADQARVASLTPFAQKIARESKKKVKLIRFSVREEIAEYA
jgi:hypothetical protein